MIVSELVKKSQYCSTYACLVVKASVS